MAELRNALNFRFGRFPNTTIDPVLTTPPRFIKLKQWPRMDALAPP